jgi:hypothetical protein
MPEAALRYALKIIECYEREVRNAGESIGVDLVSRGFCQGALFATARADIERLCAGSQADL